MKEIRYLLFGSDTCYYAEGGARDLLKASDNTESLIELINSNYENKSEHAGLTKLDWWHIYDLFESKIIMGSKTQPHPGNYLSKECVVFKRKNNGWFKQRG
jgi:hypothetical protein